LGLANERPEFSIFASFSFRHHRAFGAQMSTTLPASSPTQNLMPDHEQVRKGSSSIGLAAILDHAREPGLLKAELTL